MAPKCFEKDNTTSSQNTHSFLGTAGPLSPCSNRRRCRVRHRRTTATWLQISRPFAPSPLRPPAPPARSCNSQSTYVWNEIRPPSHYPLHPLLIPRRRAARSGLELLLLAETVNTVTTRHEHEHGHEQAQGQAATVGGGKVSKQVAKITSKQVSKPPRKQAGKSGTSLKASGAASSTSTKAKSSSKASRIPSDASSAEGGGSITGGEWAAMVGYRPARGRARAKQLAGMTPEQIEVSESPNQSSNPPR